MRVPWAIMLNDDTVTASTALAAAIALHTVEESFQVPWYHRALGLDRTSTVSQVLLDSVPIFIVLPLSAYLSSYHAWIRGTLATVALTHPLLDHVALTVQWRKPRPGLGSALGLLLPLGVWNVAKILPTSHSSVVGGGAVGFFISILLYVAATMDIESMIHKTRDNHTKTELESKAAS